jgi:hypothetical protein
MPKTVRKRNTVGSRQLALARNELQSNRRSMQSVTCDICYEEKPLHDTSMRTGCPEQCKSSHVLCKVCESTMRNKVKQTGGYLQCPWCRTSRGPLYPTPQSRDNSVTSVEIVYHSPSLGTQTGLTPVEAVMLLSENSFLHSHATRVTLERRFQEIIAIASAHRHRNAATQGATE